MNYDNSKNNEVDQLWKLSLHPVWSVSLIGTHCLVQVDTRSSNFLWRFVDVVVVLLFGLSQLVNDSCFHCEISSTFSWFWKLFTSPKSQVCFRGGSIHSFNFTSLVEVVELTEREETRESDSSSVSWVSGVSPRTDCWFSNEPRENPSRLELCSSPQDERRRWRNKWREIVQNNTGTRDTMRQD